MVAKTFVILGVIICLIALLFLNKLNKNDRPITLMATTTTEDSGLLSVIIPQLEKDTGLNIQVVTFGTGKVLRSAKDGNADVILVHDPQSEKEFLSEGYAKERLPIMRNDFVLLGPQSNPAMINPDETIVTSFNKIFETNSAFVSRGDESGTHKAEQRIWKETGVDINNFSPNNYIVTGAGMGSSLNIAVEKPAYILADRATWLTFKNQGDLTILNQNGDLLENVYSVLAVNSQLHPHIPEDEQTRIMDWFKSEKSKSIIREFKFFDQPLFEPIS